VSADKPREHRAQLRSVADARAYRTSPVNPETALMPMSRHSTGERCGKGTPHLLGVEPSAKDAGMA